MVEKKKFSKGKKAVAETKAKSPELMTDFDLSELVKAAKEVVPDVFIPEKGSLTEVSDWIAMPGPICEVLGDVPGLPCGHVVEILGPSDSGKCHPRNTPILMHDGSVRMVQDIVPGDKLMGPDSKARDVLSISQDVDMIYDIVPNYGESWGCNIDHILSLYCSSDVSEEFRAGEVYNISLKKYLGLKKYCQAALKLYKVGVEFKDRDVPYDPRWVGLWLGDGSVGQPYITKDEPELEIYFEDFSDKYGLIYRKCEYEERCSRHTFTTTRGLKNDLGSFVKNDLYRNMEKRIPSLYLVNSREKRLELLAGLLDSDGYMNVAGFEIITKYRGLCDDILFLARSLGLRATFSMKKGTIDGVLKGYYFRIYISGNCDEIPILISRKVPNQRRDPRRSWVSGFEVVERTCPEDYFGFTLSGDGLYLLSDFTVTHNTTLVTHAFIGAQSDDGLAVLADSEHKYDIDRAVAMGLDPKRLIIVPIETIEQAFDKFVAMMKVIRAKPEWSKRKIVFAWDSIGSTPCENELDEKTKDHAMLAAKALKAGLRKIRYFLRKTNASLLLINHVYEKQTKTPWEKKTRGYGGHAPEYFSTIRLECRAIGKITRKKKVDGKDVSVRLGIESEVECIKNHVAAPFRRVKIEIDRRGVVFGGRKAEL